MKSLYWKSTNQKCLYRDCSPNLEAFEMFVCFGFEVKVKIEILFPVLIQAAIALSNISPVSSL